MKSSRLGKILLAMACVGIVSVVPFLSPPPLQASQCSRHGSGPVCYTIQQCGIYAPGGFGGSTCITFYYYRVTNPPTPSTPNPPGGGPMGSCDSYTEEELEGLGGSENVGC